MDVRNRKPYMPVLPPMSKQYTMLNISGSLSFMPELRVDRLYLRGTDARTEAWDALNAWVTTWETPEVTERMIAMEARHYSEIVRDIWRKK